MAFGAKGAEIMGLKNVEVKCLEKKTDERGFLVEVFKILPSAKGAQVFVSTTKAGIERGGHFHKRKTEWFCVLQGRGTLYLQEGECNKKEIMLNAESPSAVKIPPNVSHRIKNTGTGEMLLLVLADEIFDEQDADTHRPAQP